MLPLLEEQESAARSALAGEVFDYFDAGSGAETTRREAEGAWDAFRLLPHVLRDVADAGCEVELLGADFAHPFAVAPMAFHGLATERGELATAAACARAGALMVLSTRSSRRIEDVAAAASGPWWFQVYVMRDRVLTERLVVRARDAGAHALVLTGDTPLVGAKSRVTGTRIQVPDDQYLVNLREHLGGRDDGRAAAEQDPGIDLGAIRWLSEISGLPVLVKGVLRADDALRCLDAGAAGVIVSNHGGRQLDRAVPSAWALAEVCRRVGDRAPVLVDGGIRSGADALVALALGARAVLVGRPVLWALAAGGEDAVLALLRTLRADLLHVLALSGHRRLHELAPDVVADVRPRPGSWSC